MLRRTRFTSVAIHTQRKVPLLPALGRQVRDETPQKLFSRGQFACNRYNECVEKKIFWIVFMVLGLVADVVLPIWWALAATIPIVFVSWWVAYRSEWF